jgi:hypothetical protein
MRLRRWRASGLSGRSGAVTQRAACDRSQSCIGAAIVDLAFVIRFASRLFAERKRTTDG